MNFAPESVGETWLWLLKARGVDFLFANAGTDFPSIVEAIARAGQTGAEIPRPVVCGHENAAISMAHGHAMVSGRAQAAMVHVNVGTANALNGLINADRDYVPLLLAAGRTPFLEAGEPGARSLNIHWAQEMFDQAGMVRESVRWDYEIRHPGQLVTATDRALAIAHSEPAGPVYMTLPREVLAMAPASPEIPAAPVMRPALAGAPDPAGIAAAAEALAGAKSPVIVTARAGADKQVPALLSRLAARIGAPVVEYRPRHLNLSSEDPFHGGFEIAPWLAAADVVLVMECDVPWIPAHNHPAEDLTVIQVGIDPLQARYPMRGFHSDLTIRSAPRLFIEAMLAELGAPPDDAGDERAATVRARCAGMRDEARAGAQIQPREITMAWASACLDRARAPGSILVNEYPLVRSAMTTTEPGEFYGSSPSGGLGWGLPAAMGAKLAAPEREVIAAVGDGSHLFANPIACHQIAAAEGIAILVMIFNNAGWGAVARATRAMYPDGHAARANRMPLTRFEPAPDFAAVARACGLWGDTVEDPALLPAALERAFAEVRGNGRSAVLDVRCAG
ncbi:thiamine pyrophosphate-requiring protein [Acuticoccus sediminis]|uniref:thiamine pyrophosphate-requiring protein n=1 Tax=Acuticoccus sediminis TaxID=2184697 RepID=UPI001CFEF23D|nr:thiamine pyrophosphate-requiring protein [Acuticoccus sediminis]